LIILNHTIENSQRYPKHHWPLYG